MQTLENNFALIKLAYIALNAVRDDNDRVAAEKAIVGVIEALTASARKAA